MAVVLHKRLDKAFAYQERVGFLTHKKVRSYNKNAANRGSSQLTRSLNGLLP